MNPTYVSKTLITASSTGIGIVSSAGVNTINSSQLDTQRRVSIFSTGATLASVSFTIVGTREGGGVVRETITGVTSNAAVATTQDFLSVTSVTPSSVMTNRATIGTNDTGGTPWQSVNLHVTPIQIAGALTFSTSANSMAASIEYTMDNPFLMPPAQVPGGMPYPLNSIPTVFVSSAFAALSTNSVDVINIAGSGIEIPIAAWRLSLTSSSSTAGNVNCAAIQAGIG